MLKNDLLIVILNVDWCSGLDEELKGVERDIAGGISVLNEQFLNLAKMSRQHQDERRSSEDRSRREKEEVEVLRIQKKRDIPTQDMCSTS